MEQPRPLSPADQARTPVHWLTGLSARLLVLTVIFVMGVTALIMIPALANSWREYLDQRLAAAHLASLARDATQDGALSEELQLQVMRIAGVRGVALKQEDYRELVLSDRQPIAIDAVYDLRHATLIDRIVASFATLARQGRGQLQVVGEVQRMPGEYIEIVLDEALLYRSMIGFAKTTLIAALLIALMSAFLIYWALHWLIVRPMRCLTENIVHFRADPENPAVMLETSVRKDEIGVASREITRMQAEIRRSLVERAHLAGLGAAVGRISHDLRNILAALQLASDSLARIEDVRVKAISDRVLRAVDRGLRLCQDTLAYGKASEPAPVKRVFALAPLIEEVALLLELGKSPDVQLAIEVDPAIEVVADADQLFRVLLNLIRNALEAMQQRGSLSISAGWEADRVVVRVSDSGPGVPERQLATLFQPFAHSGKKGGSGLGLAIAAELIRGHGRRLWLDRNDARGACFAFDLDQP